MDILETRKKLPKEQVMEAVADLFNILGYSTRARILFVLEQGELCVSDIAECLEMTKYAVSHQLRILRQGKLVRTRREGKEIFYAIDDEHVSQIFDCALAHVQEDKKH